MKSLYLSAILLSLYALGAADETIFIPSMYVTETLQRPNPGQAYNYSLHLCPGEDSRYDNFIANVSINLPYNLEWVPTLGYVTLKVSNATSWKKPFCTNVDNKDGNGPNCLFVYHKEMGNELYFNVTANEADGIQFTFGIDFREQDQLPRVADTPRSFSPFQASPGVPSFHWYKPKLVQNVKLTAPGKVKTTESVLYSFAMCRKSSQKEIVVVNVFANDASSAFSTYLCSSSHCGPAKNSVTSDTSNSQINKVSADIEAFSDGSVYVLITGFGGTEVNEFYLLVSTKKRSRGRSNLLLSQSGPENVCDSADTESICTSEPIPDLKNGE
ncbi:uncharacterized protein [Oscarella lobularis]|uniref:uncharacterized protein isoform X1 n=1 Tax=Oscarella lobularis TaxID=121494 RepID=UPI003314062B